MTNIFHYPADLYNSSWHRQDQEDARWAFWGIRIDDYVAENLKAPSLDEILLGKDYGDKIPPSLSLEDAEDLSHVLGLTINLYASIIADLVEVRRELRKRMKGGTE